MYQYKISWCYVCNQGWIEIVKEKETNKIFFMCNECESEWDSINDLLNKKGNTQDKYGEITTPDEQDIFNNNLDKYILK